MPCMDFLLKRMDHPKFVGDLHCIDDPVRIAPKCHCYFKNTGSQPVHRLRNIGLCPFGGNREGGKEDRPGTLGKLFEILQRCPHP